MPIEGRDLIVRCCVSFDPRRVKGILGWSKKKIKVSTEREGSGA